MKAIIIGRKSGIIDLDSRKSYPILPTISGKGHVALLTAHPKRLEMTI